MTTSSTSVVSTSSRTAAATPVRNRSRTAIARSSPASAASNSARAGSGAARSATCARSPSPRRASRGIRAGRSCTARPPGRPGCARSRRRRRGRRAAGARRARCRPRVRCRGSGTPSSAPDAVARRRAGGARRRRRPSRRSRRARRRRARSARRGPRSRPSRPRFTACATRPVAAVDGAGDADADRARTTTRRRPASSVMRSTVRQCGRDDLLGAEAGRHAHLVAELAVGVDRDRGRLGAADVDAEPHGASAATVRARRDERDERLAERGARRRTSRCRRTRRSSDGQPMSTDHDVVARRAQRVDRVDGERRAGGGPCRPRAPAPGSGAGSASARRADRDDRRVVEPRRTARRRGERPRTDPTARRRPRCSRRCRRARRCRRGRLPRGARARHPSPRTRAAMRASSSAVVRRLDRRVGSAVGGQDAGARRRRARAPARPPRARAAAGKAIRTRPRRSIAATISSSCSSVLSVPMQSRSQPAASARTAASGMPCSPLAPVMSSASVTMTPSKPSSSRSRPCRMRGERVAGLLRRRAAGSRMCEVMIVRAPAAIAARNGTSSRCAQRLERQRRRRAARGASPVACRRGPGSAWRSRRRRSHWMPAHPGRRRARATSSGSAPKLRTPMTGLSGLEFTSTSGAKVDGACRLAASASPTARATRSVRSRSSMRPSTALPGYGRTAVVEEPGDVAALLVDRDDGERVRARDGIAFSARSCCGDRDVRAEEADAAEARSQAVEQPVGRLGAVEAREQVVRMSRRRSSPAPVVVARVIP